tara:strand:- start:958 stop:1458 length:501 start_codon:yes stop_codon:yes gene_type:complete
MGDRVGCTLEVWGVTTQKHFRDICVFLDNEFGGGVDDLIEELSDGSMYLEEIEGGDLPRNVEDVLKAAGLGYCWGWGSGAEFQSGYTVYDPHAKETYTNLTVGLDVHIPLHKAADEIYVKRAHDAVTLRAKGYDTPLIVAQTSHEYVEAIANQSDETVKEVNPNGL